VPVSELEKVNPMDVLFPVAERHHRLRRNRQTQDHKPEISTGHHHKALDN
jgi:hypothetical protein